MGGLILLMLILISFPSLLVIFHDFISDDAILASIFVLITKSLIGNDHSGCTETMHFKCDQDQIATALYLFIRVHLIQIFRSYWLFDPGIAHTDTIKAHEKVLVEAAMILLYHMQLH